MRRGISDQMMPSTMNVSDFDGLSTAVLAHRANPRLVNHFLKRYFVNFLQLSVTFGDHQLLKLVGQNSRDTQRPTAPKDRNEFMNISSVDGLVSEGVHQPSEIGWESHEKFSPS
jgi:homospermidine synthase